MIRFKRKEFGAINNILESTVKGATIGASGGGFASALGANFNIFRKKGSTVSTPTPPPNPNNNKNNNKGGKHYQQDQKDDSKLYKERLATIGSSALVGAGLGLIVGITKEIGTWFNRRNANDRYMNDIVSGLEKLGYKEGKSFVRDPKAANLMKTKVCFVLSRDAAEFKMILNTVSDKKLQIVNDKITQNIKSKDRMGKVEVSRADNKYNELHITTVHNKVRNIDFVIRSAEEFIKAGYTVYLVEVG